jgi:SAM-dependent methyltransferase
VTRTSDLEGPRETARTYYTEKLRQHGASARGVDWPSAASQYLRFAQLLKVCDLSQAFSVNDFGCGYGALLDYFAFRGIDTPICYTGIDISAEMVTAARAKWSHRAGTAFVVGATCPGLADYSVASGVFNIKLHWPVEAWEAYVASILMDLRASSRHGFAVNFVLPVDGPSDQRLYRTTPDRWIGFLRDMHGCAAELITDYGLQEFTLLVRTGP